MTRHRELDDVLREWVDHGDERLPQHYLAAALAEIDTTPQRGARPALLEGLLMRLQPAAPILGLAAVVIAAIALYAVFARPNVGGPDNTARPLPSPTYATEQLETTEFSIPVTLSLDAPADPAGWAVRETDSLLSLKILDTYETQVVFLVAAETQAVGPDGATFPLPDDLPAWLDAQDGVESDVAGRPDTRDPLEIDVLGQRIPMYGLDTDPGQAGDRLLLQTLDGYAFSVSDEAAGGWLARIPTEHGDLLAIYYGPASDEPVNWTGAFFAMLESLEVH